MIKMNLCETLNDLCQLLEDEITGRRLTFSYSIRVGTPLEIKAGRDDIIHALLLLVGSAIKFTREGGIEIFACLERDHKGGGPQLRFTVSDTGCGMGLEMRTRLFTLFSRSDPASPDLPGDHWGVELSLVQRFVSRLGGSIGFHSEEGEGSSFWFLAPCELLPDVDQVCCAHLERARVLLVTDSDTDIDAAASLRKKGGHTLVSVESGFSALQILAEQDFNLVLIDLQMPEEDGFETIKYIRQGEMDVLDPEISIVALTAQDQDDDLHRGMAAGMNDLIRKPIDPDELTRILGEVMCCDAGQLRGWRHEPVLDQSDLLRRIGGDEELMIDLLQVFLGDVPVQLRDLEQSLTDGDHTLLIRKTHSIKGAAANVGAHAMSVFAKEMERLSREGKLDRVAMLVPRLKRELTRLRKQV